MIEQHALPIKIVAIVGSLRKESFNRQLAMLAKDAGGDRADFEILVFCAGIQSLFLRCTQKSDRLAFTPRQQFAGAGVIR